MSTKITLGKLKLKNPVILASGTFDRNITKHVNVENLGAVITKTITLEPREGNPFPHIVKTKFGFLNSVGLKNIGLEKYLSGELPFWQSQKTMVITSIGGNSEAEYIKLAKLLNNKVKAIEVNVSCPNVDHGGMAFGTDEKILGSLVKKIRKVFKETLIVKLSPNVTDIVLLAKAALDSGADALNIVNTFTGIEIDNKKKTAKIARIVGGYSGPAIKPMALRCVWQVYKATKCDIIGSGGITDFNDALDFVMCGATAINIGSIQYNDPKISEKIVDNFEKYMIENKLKNLNKIKGII